MCQVHTRQTNTSDFFHVFNLQIGLRCMATHENQAWLANGKLRLHFKRNHGRTPKNSTFAEIYLIKSDALVRRV
jgi:hypothetical protein